MLAGKKTYLIALAIAVLAAAEHLGYISSDVANTLFLLLTGGGLAALRKGVSHGG